MNPGETSTPPGHPAHSHGASAIRTLSLAVLIVLVAAGASAAAPPATDPEASSQARLRRVLARFLPDEASIGSVASGIETEIGGLPAGYFAHPAGVSEVAVRDLLRRNIIANLEEKAALASAAGAASYPLDAGEILSTVAGYEVFKLEVFLRSGVFPKRYFGCFDGKWDTAEYEIRLLRRAHEVVVAVNEYQSLHRRPTRMTDIELLVTYLSEGGVLLFTRDQKLLEPGAGDAIDLYYHLGCDNIGAALSRYPELTRFLDERFSTSLASRVTRPGVGETGEAYTGIARGVDFMTSISAAAIMYLYEKDIAAAKLAAEGAKGVGTGGWPRFELMPFSLDEQFIISSLVFNTGILFSWETVLKIHRLETLDYLHHVSAKATAATGSKARPALPVPSSREEALREVLASGYPVQPTSWQGGYHVLQRYGAFVALQRFSTAFDAQGRWAGTATADGLKAR